MKKLLLMTAILTAVATETVSAKDYTHYCACAKEAVNVNCDTECTKKDGFWSGKAILRNTNKVKGIECYCNNKDTKGNAIVKTVRCEGSSSKCGLFKGKWTGVIGVAGVTDKDVTVAPGTSKLQTLEGGITNLVE